MSQQPFTREDYNAFKDAYGIGEGFYGDPSLQIARTQAIYGEQPVSQGAVITNQPTAFERWLPTIEATRDVAREITGIPSIDRGMDEMARGYYNRDGVNPMMMVRGAGQAVLGSMPYNPVTRVAPLSTLATGLLASNADATMPERQPEQYNRMMMFAQPGLGL